jgi:S1-C subfamily serine protease
LAAIEMVRRSGQQGVPVIATDDEVIVGFDQLRLARLADRHAGPRRPPLGVMAADAADYLARHAEDPAAKAGLSSGVYVGRIRPGTVAERAGLRPGDVITGLAGKRVRATSTLDQLIEAVKPGEAVSVAFWREGEDRKAILQF